MRACDTPLPTCHTILQHALGVGVQLICYGLPILMAHTSHRCQDHAAVLNSH